MERKRQKAILDNDKPHTVGGMARNSGGVTAVDDAGKREVGGDLEARQQLTQKRLKEVLHYCAETGVFIWAKNVGSNVKAGEVACTATTHGYLRFGIDGRQYYAHRLAWLYVHGEFPNHVIDHINFDKKDNRIVNLRAITQAQNMQNRKATIKSTAGVIGAQKSHLKGRFRSRIWKAGKVYELGYFKSAEAAHAAYVEAKRKVHEFGTL